jgi:membrane protein YdbS with pleckstrin-like domain
MTSHHIEEISESLYERVWAILVNFFRVPKEAPSLPVRPDDTLETFRPSDGFLRYLKFWFWLGLLAMDLFLFIVLIAIYAASPLIGVVVTPPMLALIVLPDIVAYVAVHLRYDTTWYVMTRRSLRIRRGIWSIQEVTITFENVQNVKVQQGPLERYYGIANVIVETAGAGSAGGQHGLMVANRGVIEGVQDAAKISAIITKRLRDSKTAGLGDESPETLVKTRQWSKRHIDVLREIRDEVRTMSG